MVFKFCFGGVCWEKVFYYILKSLAKKKSSQKFINEFTNKIEKEFNFYHNLIKKEFERLNQNLFLKKMQSQ